MPRFHPANCSCRCHAYPDNTRLEVVNLRGDDPINHRRFINAILDGFSNPIGLHCRDCGQYYGADEATDKLRPITGNQTFGPHPDIAPGRFPKVAPLGWRALNWLTPAFAPVWLQVQIRDGIRSTMWEIVTVWTMDD